ncbi:hypothetical protein J116_027875 [Streptomyces thermolilacinus SPC6]|uniref:Uncharacterized protein n=1 Tax=Streptomyces thermolilacinus SPC6 TaxID=1306406 RepID=A0A1D3DZE6_9ACTN|nr:hypothetical protein J116_027875 [Streptomyces thermolilacinus SPC6]
MDRVVLGGDLPVRGRRHGEIQLVRVVPLPPVRQLVPGELEHQRRDQGEPPPSTSCSSITSSGHRSDSGPGLRAGTRSGATYSQEPEAARIGLAVPG